MIDGASCMAIGCKRFGLFGTLPLGEYTYEIMLFDALIEKGGMMAVHPLLSPSHGIYFSNVYTPVTHGHVGLPCEPCEPCVA